MATRTENLPVVGEIHTAFGVYELLDEAGKRIGIPLQLRDLGAISFYVRDGCGYAKTIIVKGDFLIVPSSLPKIRPVTFVVEEVPEQTPIEGSIVEPN